MARHCSSGGTQVRLQNIRSLNDGNPDAYSWQSEGEDQ